MSLSDEPVTLPTAASDWEEAESLKPYMARLHKERQPCYITPEDIEPIFQWKLINQYRRNIRWHDSNFDISYRIGTTATSSFDEADDEMELELKVGFLTSLRGIGVPIASAILALVEPDCYRVVNFSVWRCIFRQKRCVDGTHQYKAYLNRVREIAQELGRTPQKTDLAFWELKGRLAGLRDSLRPKLLSGEIELEVEHA